MINSDIENCCLLISDAVELIVCFSISELQFKWMQGISCMDDM